MIERRCSWYRWLASAFITLFTSKGYAAAQIVASAAIALAAAPDESRDLLFPRLAYGTNSYLIVWQQGSHYYQGPSADLYARRLDEFGHPLAEPFALCKEKDSQEQPQVAYSHEQFLVVWQDFRNGRNWDVYGARITSNGQVLDPDGFLIAGGKHNQALPAVAPGEQGFLVVWQDFSDGRFYRSHATFVATDGTVSQPQRVLYRGPPKPQLWGYSPGWGYAKRPLHKHEKQEKTLNGSNLAIVKIGKSWLLSWNDESNWSVGGKGAVTRRFARLGRDGQHIVASAIQAAPAQALGLNRGRFAVKSQGPALYIGGSVAGRGNRVGTAAMFGEKGARALPNPNREIKKHWSGWNTEAMIPLFFPPLAVDGPVAVAYGHGLFLATARGSASGRESQANRLFGVRLDENGQRLDGGQQWPVLHEAGQMLSNPDLAAGHEGFLLVFQQENGDGQQQIWVKMLRVR